MKWTLQYVLLIALVSNATGQELHKGSTAFGNSPVNIASDEVNELFIAPSQQLNELKSAKSSTSTFKVSFINFPEEAKQAFYYAVSIWEEYISSPVPIHIEARWESLEGNILAKGNPSIFYNNFTGAPMRNVYYPVALAEKLSGRDINSGAPDIICRFSGKYKWYFGTDGNTPSTHYDLVSSALHEITHGLGFSGFLNETDGKGYFNNNNGLPSIYDYFLFNNQDQQISDKSVFQSPSAELYKQITSENVKFCQAYSTGQEQKMIDWIYAPSKWNDGTSIYHLKSYAYGEENGLMSPYAVKGQAIHNPGEVTLAILNELGWKNVSFEFIPLKDIEKTVAQWPLQVKVKSNDDEFSNVKVVYSTDDFSTANYSYLQPGGTLNGYEGDLILDYKSGKLEYYIEVTTSDNRTYRHPAEAPSKPFTMNIGPDYFVPDLFHNPVKLVSANENEMNITARVSDNLGINGVRVDYKVNGTLQEPVYLKSEADDLFSGRLPLIFHDETPMQLEYKLTAEDASSRNNKRVYPAIGYQEVKVFSPFDPITRYSTGFEENPEDFDIAEFEISTLGGFSGNILHTRSPYPVSALENDKYNLVAQLKYPIIIQQGGLLQFDEVVLVEPGEAMTSANGSAFWDYVIVEASKDRGKTWLSLSGQYNSGKNEKWYTAFTKSFSNNLSTATPHASLFVNHTINLTSNTGLEAGDTAVFRFRLASDNSVNGFGWAIDNLMIQESQELEKELFAEGSFHLYPNPAKNHFFIEWSKPNEDSRLDVLVTDMYGKIVRSETNIQPDFSSRAQIDLAGVNPGMYLVSINQGMKVLSTNKIIKN